MLQTNISGPNGKLSQQPPNNRKSHVIGPSLRQPKPAATNQNWGRKKTFKMLQRKRYLREFMRRIVYGISEETNQRTMKQKDLTTMHQQILKLLQNCLNTRISVANSVPNYERIRVKNQKTTEMSNRIRCKDCHKCYID